MNDFDLHLLRATELAPKLPLWAVAESAEQSRSQLELWRCAITPIQGRYRH